MDTLKLANLLFPMELKTPEFYNSKYPQRDLKEGAIVTRFAPSPTGFLHFGGVFTSYVANRVAKQTGGKYILRIEDTDKKREIEGGVEYLIKGLYEFDVDFDEYEGSGNYGPYRQSERKEIYMTFAKKLVEEGKAYPCFCTSEELAKDRETQDKEKHLLGYNGNYARCRNLSYEEIESRINAGEKFAIRLRVNSSPDVKLKVKDAIRGELKISDNYNDVVILKSDFLPPYNFAHVIDDTLMRVNLVVRGDEYIPSIAEHIGIFKALGFKPIKYAHVAPIQKMDGDSRRKISKRKDPEAAISYYAEVGYPAASVKEYILTVANSNFEDWRRQNKDAKIEEFEVAFKKMGASGALFDFAKLSDVSKTVISRMNAKEVYDLCLAWAKKYDQELFKLLEKHETYSIEVLNIEREQKRPRQDIEKWSDVKELNSYFYDELYNPQTKEDFQFDYSTLVYEDVKKMLDYYVEGYEIEDEKPDWFAKIKLIATKMDGYADDMKEYKANPSNFKGNYGTISTIIRIALTGKTQTPDLYQVCKMLGKNKIASRMQKVLEIIK